MLFEMDNSDEGDCTFNEISTNCVVPVGEYDALELIVNSLLFTKAVEKFCTLFPE